MWKRINAKKRIIISLLILTLGILIVNAIIPNPGHSANNILLTKNEFSMTLQNANDNNFFVFNNNPSQNYIQEISDEYHNADEIFIIASEQQMSLQEALTLSLTNHDILCSGGTTQIEDIFKGHSANNVEILIAGVSKTLQEAINNGDLCSCSNNWKESCGGGICITQGTYNCDGICTGEYTQTSGEDCGSGNVCSSSGQCCVPNIDQSCGGNECTNAGTYDCEGLCVGTTYKPEGTICEGSNQCDGSGNCQSCIERGYCTGTGCGPCPFGSGGGAYAWCNLPSGWRGRLISCSGSGCSSIMYYGWIYSAPYSFYCAAPGRTTTWEMETY